MLSSSNDAARALPREPQRALPAPPVRASRAVPPPPGAHSSYLASPPPPSSAPDAAPRSVARAPPPVPVASPRSLPAPPPRVVSPVRNARGDGPNSENTISGAAQPRTSSRSSSRAPSPARSRSSSHSYHPENDIDQEELRARATLSESSPRAASEQRRELAASTRAVPDGAVSARRDELARRVENARLSGGLVVPEPTRGGGPLGTTQISASLPRAGSTTSPAAASVPTPTPAGAPAPAPVSAPAPSPAALTTAAELEDKKAQERERLLLQQEEAARGRIRVAHDAVYHEAADAAAHRQEARLAAEREVAERAAAERAAAERAANERAAAAERAAAERAAAERVASERHRLMDDAAARGRIRMVHDTVAHAAADAAAHRRDAYAAAQRSASDRDAALRTAAPATVAASPPARTPGSAARAPPPQPYSRRDASPPPPPPRFSSPIGPRIAPPPPMPVFESPPPAVAAQEVAAPVPSSASAPAPTPAPTPMVQLVPAATLVSAVPAASALGSAQKKHAHSAPHHQGSRAPAEYVHHTPHGAAAAAIDALVTGAINELSSRASSGESSRSTWDSALNLRCTTLRDALEALVREAAKPRAAADVSAAARLTVLRDARDAADLYVRALASASADARARTAHLRDAGEKKIVALIVTALKIVKGKAADLARQRGDEEELALDAAAAEKAAAASAATLATLSGAPVLAPVPAPAPAPEPPRVAVTVEQQPAAAPLKGAPESGGGGPRAPPPPPMRRLSGAASAVVASLQPSHVMSLSGVPDGKQVVMKDVFSAMALQERRAVAATASAATDSSRPERSSGARVEAAVSAARASTAGGKAAPPIVAPRTFAVNTKDDQAVATVSVAAAMAQEAAKLAAASVVRSNEAAMSELRAALTHARSEAESDKEERARLISMVTDLQRVIMNGGVYGGSVATAPSAASASASATRTTTSVTSPPAPPRAVARPLQSPPHAPPTTHVPQPPPMPLPPSATFKNATRGGDNGRASPPVPSTRSTVRDTAAVTGSGGGVFPVDAMIPSRLRAALSTVDSAIAATVTLPPPPPPPPGSPPPAAARGAGARASLGSPTPASRGVAKGVRVVPRFLSPEDDREDSFGRGAGAQPAVQPPPHPAAVAASLERALGGPLHPNIRAAIDTPAFRSALAQSAHSAATGGDPAAVGQQLAAMLREHAAPSLRASPNLFRSPGSSPMRMSPPARGGGFALEPLEPAPERERFRSTASPPGQTLRAVAVASPALRAGGFSAGGAGGYAARAQPGGRTVVYDVAPLNVQTRTANRTLLGGAAGGGGGGRQAAARVSPAQPPPPPPGLPPQSASRSRSSVVLRASAGGARVVR